MAAVESALSDFKLSGQLPGGDAQKLPARQNRRIASEPVAHDSPELAGISG